MVQVCGWLAQGGTCHQIFGRIDGCASMLKSGYGVPGGTVAGDGDGGVGRFGLGRGLTESGPGSCAGRLLDSRFRGNDGM